MSFVGGGFSNGYLGNYQSAINNVYQLNDASYALADSVTGYESSDRLAAIGAQNKAIDIAKSQNDLRAEYSYAANQDTLKREKQEWKTRQDNIAKGYIFG